MSMYSISNLPAPRRSGDPRDVNTLYSGTIIRSASRVMQEISAVKQKLEQSNERKIDIKQPIPVNRIDPYLKKMLDLSWNK